MIALSRGTFVAGFALALVALPGLLCAQELKRTELKRTDLTGTNMEVILGITEIPPGGTLPKHFHHGEEAFYVLEGATVQMPGQAPRLVATGAGGINVRGVPHGGFPGV